MQLKNILYILPVAALFTACGSSPANTILEKDTTAPVPVTLAVAGASADNALVEMSGQMVSSHAAAISTRMMGYITKMNVGIGDNVHAGQLLFSIQSTDIKAKDAQVAANIAAADAALANAKKDLERFKILHAQNSATDRELENVTLQYKATLAQSDATHQMRSEVNANMAYADVKAPFNGTVTQKMMDAGSLASPGMPILMLESAGALQATASVTEDRIKYIHLGMHVNITSDADGTIDGTVSEISRSSVATGGQYLIKINPTNSEGFLAGMYIRISIPVTTNNDITNEVIRIPLSSLVTQGDLTGVYTISNKNKALLRWLRTGRTTGSEIEVLSGLATGEKYIKEANGRIWNGAAVKY
jgi:RND family efflux transporter MFP subunit